MRLLVISHKQCWRDSTSESGYVTDGGFPMQMKALSELFDSTVLMLPCDDSTPPSGSTHLTGRNLTVRELALPRGRGWIRKLSMLGWVPQNLPRIWYAMLHVDAVHAPIPGDVGTIGMIMSFLLRKPLFVRYCGNWFKDHTMAETFWKRFMEQFAGDENVMLATGGDVKAPSCVNDHISWIFSTSLTDATIRKLGCTRTLPTDGMVRLVTVGRVDEGKGMDLVLHAMHQLIAKGIGCSYAIVGGGSFRPILERLSAELGLTDKVTFHGNLNAAGVFSVLRESDVFMLPSKTEGFPKAVLEAMAAGLPVVATPVSVLPRLIGQSGGIMLKERTPHAVADAVQHLVENPASYEQMSRHVLDVAAQYSLERWKLVLQSHLAQAWGPLQSRG